MSCLLLGKFLFNATDNHVNMMAYKKLCNEFNVNVIATLDLKEETMAWQEKYYQMLRKK